MTDIYFAAIEMDRCDKPIFVAADIENNPVIDFIGRRENLSQFSKVAEFSLLHDLEPTLQRYLAVWMFLPKLTERLAADDVHSSILSQFEICGKDRSIFYATVNIRYEFIFALIASPATTLVNAFDSFTFSAPKIRVSISVNNGIFDEPPVFTTASIEPGSSPDLAIVSSRTFSTSVR